MPFDPKITVDTATAGEVKYNSEDMTKGTVGSLAANEYDYGDNDSLGFNTIYVKAPADWNDPPTDKTNGVSIWGSRTVGSGGSSDPTTLLRSVEFDRTNFDTIDLDERFGAGFDEASFSITGWFKMNSLASSTNHYIIGDGLVNSGGEFGWAVLVRNNGTNTSIILRRMIGNSIYHQVVHNTTITVGVWYHFRVTYNKSTGQLTATLHGETQTTAASSTANIAYFSNRYAVPVIGRHQFTATSAQNYFDGRLCGISVFEGTVISDAQFDTLNNSGDGLTAAGAVAAGLSPSRYYNLNEELIGDIKDNISDAALTAVNSPTPTADGPAV